MLILLGKSATGKDTIANELIHSMGYKKLITYTSRPTRRGETDDIDYHFVDTEDFLQKVSDDFFLEYRFYKTEFGVWYYGSSIQSYHDSDDKTVAILTPSGVQSLKEHSIPHTSFYISVSDEEIKQRQLIRGDDVEESQRRFMADKRDFKDIDNLMDYKINNDKNIKEITKEINNLYIKSKDGAYE